MPKREQQPAANSTDRRSGEEFEKNPWSSKKFAFAMTQAIIWAVVLMATLILFVVYSEVRLLATIILCFMIATKGAIDIGYLMGQAGLDRYVRLTALTAGQITDGGKEAIKKGAGFVLDGDKIKAKVKAALPAAPAEPEEDEESWGDDSDKEEGRPTDQS